jgi:hypothetical protein
VAQEVGCLDKTLRSNASTAKIKKGGGEGKQEKEDEKKDGWKERKK